MRGPLGWVAAGAAAFLLCLIARFPASWAGWALPRGIECGELSGTLWSGACSGLRAGGAELGDATWSVHPLALLAGRLSLDASLGRAQGRARASIDIDPSGAISARGIDAVFAIDRDLIAQLPPGARGAFTAQLQSLTLKGDRITSVRGLIQVKGLEIRRGEPLGGYRVTFPAAASGEPTGRLVDLGGPLSVEGTVRLTPGPGYVVSGLVAARPSAPPALVANLRYLGAPDAAGRREFSVAGTF